MPLSMSINPHQMKWLREFSDTFIETGTHDSGGVQSALEADFDDIMSCELDLQRYNASKYMAGLNQTHKITLLYGDSAQLLPVMLYCARKPAVVFLDAHFDPSEGKGEGIPLDKELDALLLCPEHGHLVVVDDVDLCDKPQMPGWSLDKIKARLLEINPAYKFSLDWGARNDGLLIADPR